MRSTRALGHLAVVLLIGLGLAVGAPAPRAEALPAGVQPVAAGFFHSCGVTAAGGVRCWGANFSGQLGNGTFTQSAAPVDVVGLSSGVKAVVAGYTHSCALLVSGGVTCWGGNSQGELGNGTTTTSATPVNVSGLSSGVVAIAAGTQHVCALTSVGGVKCWGWALDGQLGFGGTVRQRTPVDVDGLTSGVASISASSSVSCAVTDGGALRCWGRNQAGQVGNGLTTNALVPAGVSGLSSGVRQAAAGNDHSCALLVSGAVQCWGANANGQLGNGTTTSSLTPVAVTGLGSGVTQLENGGTSTCAAGPSVPMTCWGANPSGMLANGTTPDGYTSTPVAVIGSAEFAAFDLGYFHSCALNRTGTMACAGFNGYGELGDFSPPTSASYIPVQGGAAWYVEAPAALLNVGDIKVLEPDAGAMGAFVPLTLSKPLPTDVTIGFRTIDGSATGGTGNDFRHLGTSGQLAYVKIPAGKTWNAIGGVSVFADAGTEPDETFEVQVESVTTGDGSIVALGDGDGTVTIVDNYRPSSDPLLMVSDAALYEGDSDTGVTRAQFVLQFSKPVASAFTLTFQTADGTATGAGTAGGGADYRSKVGTLAIPAGWSGSKVIDVLVYGDTVAEAHETLQLQVVLPDGTPVIQRDPAGTVVLLDDDTPAVS